MGVFDVAAPVFSLSVALWKCGSYLLAKTPPPRPHAISSVSFLLLASLFAAACILSTPSERLSWLVVALASVYASGYHRTRTLASLFLAAASLSELVHNDASQTEMASVILCLSGALIDTAGSFPAFVRVSTHTSQNKGPPAARTKNTPTSLARISARPFIQSQSTLKSD